MSDIKKNAVCYYRAQKQEGINGQASSCCEYAKRLGYFIVGEYSDCGYSGTTIDRPALQRLIADSHSGSFQYVIVSELGRLNRNSFDAHDFALEFGKCGIKIVSATEDFEIGANTLSGTVIEAIKKAAQC